MDPIGFNAGDVNLFRYVGNSTTNASDPTGAWPLPLVITVVTGVLALVAAIHFAHVEMPTIEKDIQDGKIKDCEQYKELTFSEGTSTSGRVTYIMRYCMCKIILAFHNVGF